METGSQTGAHIGRPLQFDRDAVRDSLMRHFHANGFAASSARELQAASGLSASSLYRSFGSKEALFIECLRHYTDALLVSLRSLLADVDDGQAFFQALFIDAAAQAGTERARLGCLVFNSVAELGKSEGPAADEARHSLARIRRLFIKALALSPVPAGVSERALADELLMSMIGLRVMLRTGISPQRARAMVSDLLERLFVRP